MSLFFRYPSFYCWIKPIALFAWSAGSLLWEYIRTVVMRARYNHSTVLALKKLSCFVFVFVIFFSIQFNLFFLMVCGRAHYKLWHIKKLTNLYFQFINFNWENNVGFYFVGLEEGSPRLECWQHCRFCFSNSPGVF